MVRRVLSLLLFLLHIAVHSGWQLIADPDLIATGYEYSRTPQVKIGDQFTIGPAALGLMMSSRNEPRFNQEILPNHNWRGFGFLRLPVNPPALSRMRATAGVEHESAHPTMGIEEEITQDHEQVYDGLFRRYLLNSLTFAMDHRWFEAPSWAIDAKIEYRWYFMSKNTPELPTMQSAFSNGLSGGVEGRYTLRGPVSLAASAFYRSIFRSTRTDRGQVATGGRIEPVIYPIVNSTGTLAVTAAIEYLLGRSARIVRLYASALHGTLFGFVDSRDRRTILAMGIELSH